MANISYFTLAWANLPEFRAQADAFPLHFVQYAFSCQLELGFGPEFAVEAACDGRFAEQLTFGTSLAFMDLPSLNCSL